ncbi:glycerol-3-phosphate dehydrogenase [Caulobacter sp. AP07]|uniref:glycerol-3-phosphate dehydrogenase n=1 Tax=Caulobacter sp. AP07 TaxID=1144304 RepID=UPI000271DA4C|nr:glycerol-3-phosphate dehydrogenase [Caulobacter sp. AP07]EJL26603.1 glycerol-3-phosphate dehydrogenase [Caulobacter sp. AP07]
MSSRPGPYDLLVIGGGVNGASIARAAAVAGRSVLLVEQGDLAQATSSASTKLMHGGLRYLEYYEFKLVGEALKERAIMLRMAPHLVRPLEFRLPHAAGTRPWWMVRLGLWIYDLLALGGGLPASRGVRLDDPAMRDHGGRGFSYWDGWVDDARLVALNAVDAREAGAEIRTRTRLMSAERGPQLWTARLEDAAGPRVVTARTMINAAGPWVARVLRDELAIEGGSKVRLVRGSHLILSRRLAGDHAWLLQQPDGRVVFAIPYLDDFTLVGTTDIPVDRPEDAAISRDEVNYLLGAVNLYLREPVAADEIVSAYAGVRPLFDDGAGDASAVTRDYRLELDTDGAPLLSVFGGKITTARHLAAAALERLGISGGDTRRRPLPGGDIDDFEAFQDEVARRWPFLEAATARRLARAYGTRVGQVLGEARDHAGLGADFGAGLTAREIDYLMDAEWARDAEDVLWRRSKLGVRLTATQVAAVQTYIDGRTA